MTNLIKSIDKVNFSGSGLVNIGSHIKKIELLKTMVSASQTAWEKGIKPKMAQIRSGNVISSKLKNGLDFFTEADIASEAIIKKTFIDKFGENYFRFFGEEENIHTGNLDSKITIRIDPIDGTEAFKFGIPNWSIMIGVYLGRGLKSQAILATVYYPEYFSELIFYLKGAGVFIGNVPNGEIEKFSEATEQNCPSDIITYYYKHSDFKKRGKMDEIIPSLERQGFRVKSLMPTAVKEAISSKGRRAMVIDGDFNQVDFISYAILVKLGYKVYTWDGIERNIDDPSLSDQKIIVVPPGEVGKKILEVTKKYSA